MQILAAASELQSMEPRADLRGAGNSCNIFFYGIHHVYLRHISFHQNLDMLLALLEIVDGVAAQGVGVGHQGDLVVIAEP